MRTYTRNLTPVFPLLNIYSKFYMHVYHLYIDTDTSSWSLLASLQLWAHSAAGCCDHTTGPAVLHGDSSPRPMRPMRPMTALPCAICRSVTDVSPEVQLLVQRGTGSGESADSPGAWCLFFLFKCVNSNACSCASGGIFVKDQKH